MSTPSPAAAAAAALAAAAAGCSVFQICSNRCVISLEIDEVWGWNVGDGWEVGGLYERREEQKENERNERLLQEGLDVDGWLLEEIN